jgi:hypothetical protein
MEFSRPDERRDHISLEHPLELPELYLHGKPLSRESVVRVPIQKDDVDLVHCTHCEAQINGGPWQELTESEFYTQFTKSTNSTWNLRLRHARSIDGSNPEVECCIRFRIPDTTALNSVDEYFRQTLVFDEIRHAYVERFEARLPTDAPSREYGSALGDYALGVLLKERRERPRSQVGYKEFANKMRSALEVLKRFDRPVALAVCSCIRFNLNDFNDHGCAVAAELETGLRFFRSIINESDSDGAHDQMLPAVQKSSKPICPVDVTSHRLVSACDQLSGGKAMPLGDIQALQELPRGTAPVSSQDLAKVHVICAESWLRIDRPIDALPHLRAIRSDPSLKDWSQRQLNGISSHGN